MASYAESLFSGKTQSPFGPAPEVGAGLGIGKGGVMTPEVQASLVKAMDQSKAAQVQPPQVGDVNSMLMQKLQARTGQSAPQAQAPQPQSHGILDTIGGVAGDVGRGLLDTVLQPARFVERAGKGLGIKASELAQGRKFTEEELNKINNFGGPGLQASVAKTIAPSVADEYNSDAYKTGGQALGGAINAAANLATPFTGSIGKIVGQGTALGFGGALERGESLPQALVSGGIGGVASGVLSKGGAALGKRFGKTATGLADNLAEDVSKVTSKSASKSATKGPVTNLAREKAIDQYENIIGIPKAAAKNEAKQAAGRATGKDHRQAIGTLLDEGVTLKAKNEGGRQVFDTVGDIEQLNQRRHDVGAQLQAAIESNPRKEFDLNIAANRAKIKIRNLKGKLQSEKDKMIKEIDDLVQAEKNANGYKAGNQSSMAKSAKFTGGKFNEFKSGLHDKAYKNGVLKQESEHLNILASEVNDAIDRSYKDVADVKNLRKQYGDIKNAQDFLIDQNGKVVAGGRIPKLASRALGAAIGMATPIPLPGVKEYVGSEIGGKVHDFLTNPERLSSKVLKGLSEPEKQAFVSNLSKKPQDAGVPMDKISQIIESMPDLSGIAGGIIGNGATSAPMQEPSAPQAPQAPQVQPQDDVNAMLMQKLQQRKTAK